MIEVRIPKEITEYREKIIFGLNLRQLFCFAIALVVGVTSYFALKKFVGQEVASYLVIIEVVPVFAVGFLRINDMSFDRFVRLMIRHRSGNGQRKYMPTLILDEYERRTNLELRPAKTKQARAERRRSEITEQSRTKKARQAARKKAKARIAAARKEYKQAKRDFCQAKKTTVQEAQ